MQGPTVESVAEALLSVDKGSPMCGALGPIRGQLVTFSEFFIRLVPSFWESVRGRLAGGASSANGPRGRLAE